MNPLAALATAEARMLVRNRMAAFNGLALPLGFGALWLVTGPGAGGSGAAAALQLVAVLAFTIFSVATTTLVARRQQSVLKRWRGSSASTTAVLAGTLAPLGLLLVVQLTVLLGATAIATDTTPAAPVLVVMSVVAGAVLAGALAFATTAFTRTAETATVTAAPVVAALFGGALWVIGTPPAEVTWPMLATGGGALAHLTRVAWDGVAGADGPVGYLAALWPSLAATAAVSTAAVVIALRFFRWDPRP